MMYIVIQFLITTAMTIVLAVLLYINMKGEKDDDE